MKRRTTVLLCLVAVTLAGSLVIAQVTDRTGPPKGGENGKDGARWPGPPPRDGDRDQGGQDGQDRPRRRHRRPPPPPLMRVIDADHNGEISAEEIAGAAAALKKLDKNEDGKLTRDELRPPRPPRGDRPDGPDGDGDRRGPGGPPDGEGADRDGPDDKEGDRDNRRGRRGPPRRRRPPRDDQNDRRPQRPDDSEE